MKMLGWNFLMAVFELNGLIYSLYTNLELNGISAEFGFYMKFGSP